MTERHMWFCLGMWAAFALMRGDYDRYAELRDESND